MMQRPKSRPVSAVGTQQSQRPRPGSPTARPGSPTARPGSAAPGVVDKVPPAIPFNSLYEVAKSRALHKRLDCRIDVLEDERAGFGGLQRNPWCDSSFLSTQFETVEERELVVDSIDLRRSQLDHEQFAPVKPPLRPPLSLEEKAAVLKRLSPHTFDDEVSLELPPEERHWARKSLSVLDSRSIRKSQMLDLEQIAALAALGEAASEAPTTASETDNASVVEEEPQVEEEVDPAYAHVVHTVVTPRRKPPDKDEKGRKIKWKPKTMKLVAVFQREGLLHPAGVMEKCAKELKTWEAQWLIFPKGVKPPKAGEGKLRTSWANNRLVLTDRIVKAPKKEDHLLDGAWSGSDDD